MMDICDLCKKGAYNIFVIKPIDMGTKYTTYLMCKFCGGKVYKFVDRLRRESSRNRRRARKV